MCSACRLKVFIVCMKFHENMSSGFKVMERTRKLFTHKGICQAVLKLWSGHENC